MQQRQIASDPRSRLRMGSSMRNNILLYVCSRKHKMQIKMLRHF